MKLNILDRILLFLSMLLMLAVGVGIAMVCASVITFAEIAQYLETNLTGINGILIMVTVAAVMIIVAVKLIMALFSSSKEKSPSTDNLEKIVLKNGENGKIMVSSDLVKDVAVRYAKTADDVKDVECKIVTEQDGVKILLKYFLKKDIEINEFLSKAQSGLKEYVEKYSGVNVISVDLCADVNPNNTGRLR